MALKKTPKKPTIFSKLLADAASRKAAIANAAGGRNRGKRKKK